MRKPLKLLLKVVGSLILFAGVNSSSAQFNYNLYSGWNPNIPLGLVGDVEVSDNNLVWTAGPDRIVSFDGVNWQVFDASNCTIPMSLSNKLVSVNTDLWVGTFDSGLFKLDDQGIVSSFNTANSGLVNDSILDLKQNSQGELFIKTREYLMKFDGNNTWTNIDLTGVGPSGKIAVDVNDDVWLTQQYGLAQYTNGLWVIHDTTGPCPNSSAWYISANTSGVYFGNYDGFSKFSNGNWSVIPGHYGWGLSAIHADQFGYFWVANNNGGMPEIAYLFRYNGAAWEDCTSLNNPFEPEYYIKDIQMAPNGTLWITHARDLIELTNPLLSANEKVMESQMKIYPNPLEEYVIVEVKNPDQKPLVLKITNMQGKTIRTSNISSSQIKIDRENLVSGIYFLQLIKAQEIIDIKKLLVK